MRVLAIPLNAIVIGAISFVVVLIYALREYGVVVVIVGYLRMEDISAHVEQRE